MNSCATRTLLFAACTLFAATVPAQQPARRLFSTPAEMESRVALTESAASRHVRAEAMGQLPGDTTLPGMSLILKPTLQQDADLTQLLSDQQNPASTSYHQWLTPEQFGDRFGVSDADIFLLQSWLQSHGFLVQSVAESRNRIVFTGTASAVEATFRVHMQRYRRGDRAFFENSDAVQLPASFAAVVGSVDGLSTYRLTAPQGKRYVSAQATVSPQYTTSIGGHYLVPWDLRQIYGTNTLIGSGYDGTGLKIGIIGQSAVNTTQLTYFQQKTGQTVKLPTMVLVPNTGVSNRVSGDEGESELDLEYASGNAPGASVQFIYTGCTNTTSSSILSATTNCNNDGVFAALIYAVTNNLAPILSLSYGGCEEENAAYANSTLEPVLKQANAQGQTIMVSSGDSGAASCETSSSTKSAAAGLSVSYPASSVYVTGVGGTQLNSDSSTYWSSTNNSYLGSATGYIPEVAWNDTAAYSGYFVSSGGGVSRIFSKPTWQVGTGVPSDGKRDVPDVSFPANVTEHAYLTCDVDGPCTSGAQSFTLSGTTRDGGGVGGTSAAAPTFAGMLAIIEQANGGKALGNINPSLYALAEGSSSSSIFHDITSGSNIVACTVGSTDCTTGSLGYTTTTGYDLVTGLGSINIPTLQSALAGYAAKTPRIQLSTATATPVAGAAVTFTATLAGSGAIPTGTVTFSVDGAVAGSAVTLSSGAATFSYSGFTSAGSHTVSAAYLGDSNYSSGTASLSITATAATPGISLSVLPSPINLNTAATVTAQLLSSSGAVAGSVQFATDAGAVTTVPLVNGVASYTLPGSATAGVRVVSAKYLPAAGSVFVSVSSSINVVVINAGGQTLVPTVKLAFTPTSVTEGTTITLTATVSGTGATPTGQVQFSVGGTVVGTATLSGSVASLPYTVQASGSYAATAVYFGDNTYATGQASVSLAVAGAGTAVSVSSATLTVAYGSTSSGNITVSSSGNASGTTSITLSLVSYTGATFSGCYGLSPRTLTLPANGTVTGALTLYTTAASCSSAGGTPLILTQAVAITSRETHRHLRWAFLPLPLLLLLLRGNRQVARLLLFLFVAGCSLGLSGCGSGSSSASTTTGTGTGTGTGTTTTASANSGTYVIRVTASTPTSTTTLTSSTTFMLVVQ